MPFLPDTMAVLGALVGEPGVFLLDSSDGSGWSYIGVCPVRTWSGNSLPDWDKFREEARPFLGLARSSGVPFPAGIMGAVSYDLGLLLEGVVSRHPGLQDGSALFSFGYYESVLAFCHGRGQAFLCGREGSPSWRILKEASAVRSASLSSSSARPLVPPPGMALPLSDHDEARYVQMVLRALALIQAGEIYEVNCSRRFYIPRLFSLPEAFLLYQRLRVHSPVPYGAFWSAGAMKVLSASPEMFLDLYDGRVMTRPMKGTRPRGNDAAADARYRRELEESPKERAELLMVTDLLRNDLGKVCRTGSVVVRDLRTIEPYRGVFQATSCVEGRLRQGQDAFDLIEAAFPGGSVTGCPKHRAVLAIDGLELSRRGYYTGALGYISCYGDMMLNMLIRTVILDRCGAHFSAGGGIVADSDPALEYEETALKAEGMAAAF